MDEMNKGILYSKNNLSSNELIERFYLDSIEIVEDNDLAAKLVREILSRSINDIIGIINQSNLPKKLVTAANISQFSQFDDADRVVKILVDSQYENLDYKDLGYFLIGRKSELAQRKYGENHYKLAMQLGLATNGKTHSASCLGSIYRSESEEVRRILRIKLIIRIPIVREILLFAQNEKVDVTLLMSDCLSNSTVARRKPNIKTMINLIKNSNSGMDHHIFENILWGK